MYTFTLNVIALITHIPFLPKPFWSERYSSAALSNLQSCITESENIRKEIQLAATRCIQLRYQTDQLQRDIEVGLRAPADHAIQGVGVLCGTIEDLYDETKKAVVLQSEEMKRLVKLCKNQAAVVAERFKHLYDESTKMTKRGGEVSSFLTLEFILGANSWFLAYCGTDSKIGRVGGASDSLEQPTVCRRWVEEGCRSEGRNHEVIPNRY